MNQSSTGTASGSITAMGVFPGYAEARRAVEALKQAGYGDDQLGVLGPGDSEGREERSGLPGDPTRTRWEESAGFGAAAGGLAGLGAGAAVVAGLVPALGPVVAGGWVVGLIASAGTGAAVGTVVGGLAGLGVPEEDARWYAGELQSGRVIVTVRGGDASRAGEILHAAAARTPAARGTT